MLKNEPLIEVVIDSVHSALEAYKGGASRVELCSNLAEGGTTPSAGTIEIIKDLVNIDLFVMIRPRGGDFLYSDHDFRVMKKDIQMAKQIGAEGVVFGILKADGSVDFERNKALLELSRPLKVTFHRAFDMTNDPYKAMDDIIKIGFDRILTSGHENTAFEGLRLITNLVKKANDRIIIMPGGGINESNFLHLKEMSGAREFHLSGRKPIKGNMDFKKSHIKMGGKPPLDEFINFYTDSGIIKKIVDLL